jgi:toxin YhaV
MSDAPATTLIINQWTVFAHPLFCEQLEQLIAHVERLEQKDPRGYKKKNAAKRLAAIAKLAFEDIPRDPARSDYRLGNALGGDNKHWFRAKFYQQYRLFFRFHVESKILVYAWVNDEYSLPAYQSVDDAYKVFAKMLNRGQPPGDWAQLLAEARAKSDWLELVGRWPAITEPATPYSRRPA